MKTESYLKTKLNKDLWLSWWDDKCADPDYANHEKHFVKGDVLNVRIIKHTDGRVYYCYFKVIDGNLYKNQCMVDSNGKLELNCGIVSGVEELHLKDISEFIEATYSKDFEKAAILYYENAYRYQKEFNQILENTKTKEKVFKAMDKIEGYGEYIDQP